MINIKDLCKSFDGEVFLKNLTFHLGEGDRLALFGANGSGKTLLLKILATLVKPTSGTVTIGGHDAFKSPDSVRPRIGYVPANFEGYPHNSIWEYLNFFAAAYKLNRPQRASAIEDVLGLMDLTALRQRKIESLSSGEKQRLCLAKTFLHDPDIWLLDEPFSAVDVRGQTEMRVLIQELGALGKTVVLATNRLADATLTCNRVGILHQGSFAIFGDMDDISRQIEATARLEIAVSTGIDIAQEILENRDGVTALEVADGHIWIESHLDDLEIARLLKNLIDAGVTVLRFQKIERSLEELFLEVTNEGHQTASES